MDFVILADHPASETIARRLPADGAVRTLRHHSGRPWLIGRWNEDEVVSVAVGPNRIVLFGPTTTTPESLTSTARGLRDARDLDRLAGSLSGCVHLLSSIDGEVRAQGSLSGARQVFYTSTDGVTVGSDRPAVLARLAGVSIDEELLPLHLLAPYGPPWPLNTHTLWREVSSLPMGHYLHLDTRGGGRTTRWWTPPEPEVPLSTGASVLGAAIREAVEARTSRGGTVTADLSGGLDSSNLCFVAATGKARLVTTHYASPDAANDDLAWAERLSGILSPARHVVFPGEQAPGLYDEPSTGSSELEGPQSLLHVPRIEHQAELIAGLGSSTHLRGDGGDELFQPNEMALHALARTDPLRAVPHIRALRVRRRWSWATMVRNLADVGPYSRWLSDCAAGLGAPRVPGENVMGWDIVPMMPPWVSAEALAIARDQVAGAAADEPAPLAPSPVAHQMARQVHLNGVINRQMAEIGARYGVRFEAPYLDDRVVEAAMSVRLADRVSADRAKPVLSAALDGVTPAELAQRTTKGHATAEVYEGLRRGRRALLGLCEDSRLARLGLVDTEALRDVLIRTHADIRQLIGLNPTLAAERWLRSQAADPRPAVHPADPVHSGGTS
ncbi:asparagine synthase [Amycolatopsis antarctica]|uniref:asparagine synthase (glutamine-hydrolyzing) n=1 Tax=Amycolatopsis antarctica TaxID=1854586 RepID=A0A263D3T6_9PSEU|nr:asparagine synthase-related protein [Amycolatopsis antarctica]OZM73021.1 asparagine synthase [Amycolatopsis antarctica]